MNVLKVSISEVLFFLNRVVPVISIVLREATLTMSVSTSEPVSMESEIVRVVSLYTMEISEITRLKTRSSRSATLRMVDEYGL